MELATIILSLSLGTPATLFIVWSIIKENKNSKDLDLSRKIAELERQKRSLEKELASLNKEHTSVKEQLAKCEGGSNYHAKLIE